MRRARAHNLTGRKIGKKPAIEASSPMTCRAVMILCYLLTVGLNTARKALSAAG